MIVKTYSLSYNNLSLSGKFLWGKDTSWLDHKDVKNVKINNVYQKINN